jgi:hypothetical protein
VESQFTLGESNKFYSCVCFLEAVMGSGLFQVEYYFINNLGRKLVFSSTASSFGGTSHGIGSNIYWIAIMETRPICKRKERVIKN